MWLFSCILDNYFRFFLTISKSVSCLSIIDLHLEFNIFYSDHKLRDKTEEVREKRTQFFLDEDEKARKKMADIEEKLKRAKYVYFI